MKIFKIASIVLFICCIVIVLCEGSPEKRVQQTAKKPAVPAKNLIIEEYKLFPRDKIYEVDCSEPGGCVPKEVLKTREKWRNIYYPEGWNSMIKPLGYSFVKEKNGQSHDLYKDSTLVLSQLTNIRAFSMNSTRTRFMFTADYAYDSVGTDGHENQSGGTGVFLDGNFSRTRIPRTISPMYFLGDQVIKIEPSKSQESTKHYRYSGQQHKEESYEIYLDSNPIYEFSGVSYPNAVLQNFYVFNEHWILEYAKPEINLGRLVGSSGIVVIDGKSMNEKYHYREIFNYSFIKDEPFYFFRDRKGVIKISYAGKTLAGSYVEVMHYGVGFYSHLNAVSNYNMISFYGLKSNDIWYYVEAGIYE